MNYSAMTESTATLLTQQLSDNTSGESETLANSQIKKPRGPNRHERRAQAKIQQVKSKAEAQTSALRGKYFKQLQAFLDNPGNLSQQEADQAFKIALKKIFKDQVKSQADFDKVVLSAVQLSKEFLKQSAGA